MPQFLSKIIVHIVFSTKYRRNLIDEMIEDLLFSYIGAICQALECHPIQIGGYRNHVHILCQLSRKITVMEFLEEIKKRSSRWIKTQGAAYAEFYWQDGYAIFSVNPYQTKKLIQYIKNQKEHHRSQSYKKEVCQFLQENRVNYDERYLWG